MYVKHTNVSFGFVTLSIGLKIKSTISIYSTCSAMLKENSVSMYMNENCLKSSNLWSSSLKLSFQFSDCSYLPQAVIRTNSNFIY